MRGSSNSGLLKGSSSPSEKLKVENGLDQTERRKLARSARQSVPPSRKNSREWCTNGQTLPHAQRRRFPKTNVKKCVSSCRTNSPPKCTFPFHSLVASFQIQSAKHEPANPSPNLLVTLHTVGSWKRKLMSLGLWRLLLTKALSPGGPDVNVSKPSSSPKKEAKTHSPPSYCSPAYSEC